MPKNVQIRNLDDATYATLRVLQAVRGLLRRGALAEDAAHGDAALLTCDARLGRSHGHRAEVELYLRS